MTQSPRLSAHRGAILHFLADPGRDDAPGSHEYFADGLLLIEDGHVRALGPANELLPGLPADLVVQEHPQRLLLPGFVDPHIHYPQTDMIAADGGQLLDWLEHYTFPTERQFADAAHARGVAEFFLDELLRNGTTTAQVFASVHAVSVEQFFQAAQARQLRMIAGKPLMDRHCPDFLRDSAISGEQDSRSLIERWHGRGRLHYAITPRFAPTSSHEQLASAGRLAREFPDVYIHSHLAENRAEIDWVRQLFPQQRSYLAVYEHYGLLRERATYAHCIHLDAEDRRRMAATGAAAAFCPTSNLYLGSGLFDVAASDAAGLRWALATDVGAGTSFSQLHTMAEAHKVAQLQGQRLSALRAFYMATRGGAEILGLADHIGSLQPGMEADFIALDLHATPLLARRTALCRNLAELLQVLMVLGDDRSVAETWILGRPVKTSLPAAG